MSTVLIFHDVDDVAHWASSPKREEVFGPIGVSVRTFIDPNGSNKVGLIADVPDLEALQTFLGTPVAAEAMAHDGVRPETIQMLVSS